MPRLKEPTEGDAVRSAAEMFLSFSGLPVWVRFTGATLLTLGAGALRLALDDHLTGYSLFLFIPAVFLSAALFDHWSGYWATGLSLALCMWRCRHSGPWRNTVRR